MTKLSGGKKACRGKKEGGRGSNVPAKALKFSDLAGYIIMTATHTRLSRPFLPSLLMYFTNRITG